MAALKVKKRCCLIATAIVAVLLGLGCFGLVQFQRCIEMSFANPRLFVSHGATNKYQVHFLEEGFQDRGLMVFVVPSSDRQAMLKLVANLAWKETSFNDAVWSRDGSVIGCRSRVITTDAVKLIGESQNKGDSLCQEPDYTPYSFAYDFREDKSFVFKTAQSDGIHSFINGSRRDWEAHSKSIKELLDSRGGPGQEVTLREIEDGATKLDWKQWQAYKHALLN
jgi:hypothetical protein